jgi:hypothetical protein
MTEFAPLREIHPFTAASMSHIEAIYLAAISGITYHSLQLLFG